MSARPVPQPAPGEEGIDALEIIDVLAEDLANVHKQLAVAKVQIRQLQARLSSSSSSAPS